MMEAHDLRKIVDGLAEVEFKELAPFDAGSAGVFWSGGGVSPWERHPTNEELLYVFEGKVTIEVLTNDGEGSIEVEVNAGSAFVVPRNHWHRHTHNGVVKELYVTPGPSEMSFADDPRTESQVEPG